MSVTETNLTFWSGLVTQNKTDLKYLELISHEDNSHQLNTFALAARDFFCSKRYRGT